MNTIQFWNSGIVKSLLYRKGYAKLSLIHLLRMTNEIYFNFINTIRLVI